MFWSLESLLKGIFGAIAAVSHNCIVCRCISVASPQVRSHNRQRQLRWQLQLRVIVLSAATALQQQTTVEAMLKQ